MLAVYLDQQAGQLGYLGDGGGAAVDPSARTAIGADHAPDLAAEVVFAFIQGVFAQP
jgi:hypothetical protein